MGYLVNQPRVFVKKFSAWIPLLFLTGCVIENVSQPHTHNHARTKKLVSMRWVGWAALLASLMVAVQIVILLLGKDGLCLSQGCQVVDQLTEVSPLLFNIAGLLFFQAIFWGVYRVRGAAASRVKLGLAHSARRISVEAMLSLPTLRREKRVDNRVDSP